MMTSRTAGIAPAFVILGLRKRASNPFRMIQIQICIKTEDLKSFRIIHFRKNRGEGQILLTGHPAKDGHPEEQLLRRRILSPDPTKPARRNLGGDPTQGPCPERPSGARISFWRQRTSSSDPAKGPHLQEPNSRRGICFLAG